MHDALLIDLVSYALGALASIGLFCGMVALWVILPVKVGQALQSRREQLERENTVRVLRSGVTRGCKRRRVA